MSDFYINGKFITQRITGVQRYATELSKRVLNQSPNGRLITPVQQHWINKEQDYSSIAAIGTKGGVFWEQITLPGWLKRNQDPLLVNLCNVSPVWYKNKVTCIHDLAFARYPHFFSKYFYHYYRNIIPKIIKTSRHLITVSNFSKQELITYYKVPEQKITVISNGVTNHLARLDETAKQASPVNKPYFLFVGSMDPRKNLLFLLKAFEKANNKETDLVIIGAGTKSFNPEIKAKLAPYLTNPAIHFKGAVTDEELARYYYHAQALIAPSFYEGFGLPVIEALSAGCNVLASDIPAFREIGQDLVTYFDPHKEEQLVALLTTKAGMPAPHSSEGIQAISYKYNWDAQADKLVHLISNLS